MRMRIDRFEKKKYLKKTNPKKGEYKRGNETLVKKPQEKKRIDIKGTSTRKGQIGKDK